MDHLIEYNSVADYNSTIEDTISTENTIVYYVWNNMYSLEHHINHEYINDDDPITVQQGDNIMKFLYEIS
jgi:hypothetical protein